ncbi:hypothetical protein FQA39_LY02231 [Lamprigera yunnana]|nr:hypothetical protein FQA39_LY02231 [Lamprigera yunnana]
MYGQECPKMAPEKRLQITKPVQNSIPCIVEEKAVTLHAQFFNIDLELGRWDNRMLYKFYDRIVVGDKYVQLNKEFLVCLATQSSLDRLFSLIDVARNWSGPISAAIFAVGDEELNLVVFYIMYLKKCYPFIRDQVTFHLALPKNRLGKHIKFNHEYLKYEDCGNPENTLQRLLAKRSANIDKWKNKNPYPQNHLRNLARKNCQSHYVFLTDVDIIPNKGLAESLNIFLKSVACKSMCAYVIPTFEIDHRVRFPPNKTELVRLARKGLARPFHQKVFIYNQFATNFSKWEVITPEDKEVHISHPVTNFEFLYEPFYVAPDTAPSHDERFIGYGYTRNTQTGDCETMLLNQTIYYLNKSKSKWISIGLYYPFEFASVVKIFGRFKQYVIFKEEEWIQFHQQRENINKYFQTFDTMWKPRQIGSKTLTFEMIEEKKILKIEDMSGNEVCLGWESVSSSSLPSTGTKIIRRLWVVERDTRTHCVLHPQKVLTLLNDKREYCSLAELIKGAPDIVPLFEIMPTKYGYRTVASLRKYSEIFKAFLPYCFKLTQDFIDSYNGNKIVQSSAYDMA